MDLEQMKYFEILTQIDLVKFLIKGELLIVMWKKKNIHTRIIRFGHLS